MAYKKLLVGRDSIFFELGIENRHAMNIQCWPHQKGYEIQDWNRIEIDP